MSFDHPDFARIEKALNSTYVNWYIYALDRDLTVADFLTQYNIQVDDRISTYINGSPVCLEQLLNAPCNLECYQQKQAIAKVAITSKHIIYNKHDIAVVFKPAGLHTYPARGQESDSLLTELKRLFTEDIHIPSRLDYSTAGLVMVSINSRRHDFVQQLYQARWVNKTYLFASHIKSNWQRYRCELEIALDSRHPVLRQAVKNGGQSAITDFELIAEQDKKFIFKANPLTGRTHQIRVHAHSLGLPITGDNFYSGSPANTLHLVCYQLEFPDSVNSAKIKVTVPDEFKPLWLKEFTIF